ncbi:MAG TPA: FadR/GntR family transcriptional regulator [Acidimicrobiia bacterium]
MRQPTVNGLQRIEIKREPLASEVVRRIIDAILSQQMRPGDRLPSERKLSEMLGVGRSVVREALKPLSVLGLVEVRQGDGTYLSAPDSGMLVRAIEWGLLLRAHEAVDLVETRCHLEEVITELAASRRSPQQVEDLRRLLAEMEASHHDLDGFVTADMAFHTKLSEASGNGTLQQIMSGITVLLEAWIRRVMKEAGSYEPTIHEHRSVFEAVQAGDAKSARAAAAAHMSHARARLEQSLADDPTAPLVAGTPAD